MGPSVKDDAWSDRISGAALLAILMMAAVALVKMVL
jgi:hypothetical protein